MKLDIVPIFAIKGLTGGSSNEDVSVSTQVYNSQSPACLFTGLISNTPSHVSAIKTLVGTSR